MAKRAKKTVTKESAEQSYKLAKLIREGSREVARQLNQKRAQRRR